MASMRDIQRRRNSIASTQQITKAMKLVYRKASEDEGKSGRMQTVF